MSLLLRYAGGHGFVKLLKRACELGGVWYTSDNLVCSRLSISIVGQFLEFPQESPCDVSDGFFLSIEFRVHLQLFCTVVGVRRELIVTRRNDDTGLLRPSPQDLFSTSIV